MTLICRVVFHGDLPPLAWIEIRENDVAGDTQGGRTGKVNCMAAVI